MEKELLILKWLKNELTEAEMQAFKKLDDYELNVSIIDYAKCFKAPEISNVEDFNAFKERYKTKNKPVKKLYGLNPFLKIAAVLAIALGVYFTFFFNNTIQVQTLAGEKSTIELPDYSTVTLNAHSKIEYNKSQWDTKREIQLDGEAFFKVLKGSTFNVITTDGIVTVVGTQFNVKQRDHYFEVICYEGKVKVTSKGIERLLEMGEVYQLLEGNFLERKTVSTAPSWKENISLFNAIPLKEVLAELERQYNVEIIYKNINTNRLFTGGFEHNDLGNALIAVTKPMNLTYELSSSNLVILHGENQ